MTEVAVENHPCANCGKLDDHPMLHIMGVWDKDENTTVRNPSFHFDCLPENAAELWGLDLSAPEHAVTAAAREAALDGIHGDELREFIAEQPSDNNLDDDQELQS